MMDLFLFIGQLHPLLIHLPIGILFSGVALFWYDQILKNKIHQSGIELLILLSCIFAILSVITGLILSTENDYDISVITKHQYSGIILTVLIIVFFIALKIETTSNVVKQFLSVLNILFVIITGHFGGTLTHGTISFHREKLNMKQEYQFNDTSSIYISMVQPILNEKCISCHGSEKQKGELRLDNFTYILKGGKTSHTADAYDQSELIKRLILSVDDKKHMPPKERTQLTLEESKAIHWWILHGAKQEIKLMEFRENDTLISFINSKNIKKETARRIPSAENDLIKELTNYNVVIYPVELNSPYLYVNLQNAEIDSQIILDILLKIKMNIIDLRMPGKKINKGMLQVISQMENLEKLDLSHSTIADSTVQQFIFPKKLKTLNLSNAMVTESYIRSIGSVSGLEKIFIYNLKSDSTIIQNMSRNNHLKIVYGKEQVPTFPTDTTFVK